MSNLYVSIPIYDCAILPEDFLASIGLVSEDYDECNVSIGDCAEPSGADQQRLYTGAGLPHGAHRLQVRRDQREV